MGLVTLVGSLIWVRLFDELARRDLIERKLSRKLVHITTGLLFMLFWPLFSTSFNARFFASAVPLINATRLLLLGLGVTRNEGMVKAMSREGSSSAVEMAGSAVEMVGSAVEMVVSRAESKLPCWIMLLSLFPSITPLVFIAPVSSSLPLHCCPSKLIAPFVSPCTSISHCIALHCDAILPFHISLSLQASLTLWGGE
ncbi:unnamed protein product [Closterium sp. NIES-65]|nr:unnamed protein product [Closterium sp. NIES-65]